VPEVPAGTERPNRLRELRLEHGWTQQDVAERLVRLAWSRDRKSRTAANADMVAKWERGAKGVSPRYRRLLAALFRVTVDQLGLPGTNRASSPADQSLVAMLDSAAELLNDLGGAGRAVRPHVLAALTDEVLTRRSALAMLDATTTAAATPPSETTLTDLEALAGRYETAHATATPAALLTAVTGHLRTLTAALPATQSPGLRQRILRNRARVAVLAGRLAAEDVGNAMAARAYYAQATDDAHETNEPAVAAIAAGHGAKLAIQQAQPTAALAHARAAADPVTDPAIRSWLASIEATAHADLGDDKAARAALGRAQDGATAHSAVSWFRDHDTAHLAAVTGHVLLRAGDRAAARQIADAAAQLVRLGPTSRRALVLCLIDQAHAELHAGSAAVALTTATRAADFLRRAPYAAGMASLRAFRDALDRRTDNAAALRTLDERLASLAA
jgi:transcriptional regulator with XRE-family HTH domain